MAMLAAAMLSTRGRAAGIAAVVSVGLFPFMAQASDTAITCANLASGAHWQIKIDYARSTVDSYPANISDGTISWRDPTDNRNYALDRKSGKLTVVVPSSTGGILLHHQCRLEN